MKRKINAQAIVVRHPSEAVRRRPEMYGWCKDGLSELLRKVIDEIIVLDPTISSFTTTVENRALTFSFPGGGFVVGKRECDQRDFIELFMEIYRTPIPIMNALCSRFELQIIGKNYIVVYLFENGEMRARKSRPNTTTAPCTRMKMEPNIELFSGEIVLSDLIRTTLQGCSKYYSQIDFFFEEGFTK